MRKREERKSVDVLRERVLALRARREQLASRAAELAGAATRAVMMADAGADTLALQKDEAATALRTIEGELAQAEAALRSALAPKLASITEELEAYDRRLAVRHAEIKARLVALAAEAEELVSEVAATPAAYARTRDDLEKRASDVVNESLGTLALDTPPRAWQRVGLGTEAMALERAALLAAQV